MITQLAKIPRLEERLGVMSFMGNFDEILLQTQPVSVALLPWQPALLSTIEEDRCCIECFTFNIPKHKIKESVWSELTSFS